jgi:hypothetical protein
VVVDGRRGGLDEEDVAPADGFLDLDVDFAVGEALDLDGRQVEAQVAGDLVGEDLEKGVRERRVRA